MDNLFRILNHLAKNRDKTYTMHALAKELCIPYASFHRAIRSLGDMLIQESIGQAKTIALNDAQPVIASQLALVSWEERNEFLTKHVIIKKLVETLHPQDIVILFGSYAKGTQTQRSDIDLLVINKQGTPTVSFAKHELLYKVPINAITVSYAEYAEMLQDTQENVGKQALRNHIVLQNPQQFWENTLHACRIQTTV